MQTTQKMTMLMWVHILFFIMVTPALSSSNKVINEKDVGTYASDKLSLGLGWSMGGIPTFGIGLGGGFGGGGGGQTSSSRLGYASPGFSFGGGGGGGFNLGGDFDLGGDRSGYGGGGESVGIAGGSSGGDYGGSSRPNSCHCNCDRTGGISGNSNGQNDRNPPSKTVTCRPMNCLNENDCGGYSKKADGSPPYWCKVSGKGILPFWCTNSGESSGKLLNCIPMNCPKGSACGGEGTRYVLDIPIWINGHGSQSNGAYGHKEPEHY